MVDIKPRPRREEFSKRCIYKREVLSRPELYLLGILCRSTIKIHLVKVQLPLPSILYQVCSSTPLNLLPSASYRLKAAGELTSVFLPSFKVYATTPYNMTSLEPEPNGNILWIVCCLEATTSQAPFLIWRISSAVSESYSNCRYRSGGARYLPFQLPSCLP